MANVQVLLFGTFGFLLLLINGFAPRIMAIRHGSDFMAYAGKHLRPWCYALSLGVFCGVGAFEGASNAFVAAVMSTLVAYVIAARTYAAR